MPSDADVKALVPRWLRFVMISDRVGSSWYVGMGFFFAPILAAVSPWPTVTAVLWVFIAVAGLWLGLLGIAMATGLAMVLRAGKEIPEDYWWSILDQPAIGEGKDRRAHRLAGGPLRAGRRRCRPLSRWCLGRKRMWLPVLDNRLASNDSVAGGDDELLRRQRIRDSAAARDEFAATS